MDYRKACEILEVTGEEDLTTIKKAYLARIKFYHPDSFEGNEEKRRYAEEKTNQINDAWKYIQSNYDNQMGRSAEGDVGSPPPPPPSPFAENPLYKPLITTIVVIISSIILIFVSGLMLHEHLTDPDIINKIKYSEEDLALMQQYYFTSERGTYAIQGKRTDLAGVVNIPDSFDGAPVTVIAEKAFANCINVKEFIIPYEIKEIHRGAFANCSGITSITIPDSVTKIERATFGTYGAFAGCENLLEAHIGKGVTALTYFMFSGCDSLKEIYIQDSIEMIEAYTFISCPNIEKIHFNGTLEQWKAVQILDYAFEYGLVIEIHCTDGVTTYHATDIF